MSLSTIIDRYVVKAKIDLAPNHRQPSFSRIVVATVLSVAGSLLADAALVAIGTSVFPATKGYVHFQFHDYAKLTVIGVIVACTAWPDRDAGELGPAMDLSSTRRSRNVRPVAPRCVDPGQGPTTDGGGGPHGHAPGHRGDHLQLAYSCRRRQNVRSIPKLGTSSDATLFGRVRSLRSAHLRNCCPTGRSFPLSSTDTHRDRSGGLARWG